MIGVVVEAVTATQEYSHPRLQRDYTERVVGGKSAKLQTIRRTSEAAKQATGSMSLQIWDTQKWGESKASLSCDWI